MGNDKKIEKINKNTVYYRIDMLNYISIKPQNITYDKKISSKI